ncbi:MAG: DUF3830 family protein [Clostridia bacterium]|jgi:hypothetical protein|nr:DUF3830 family protein [Clostridia bacterium]MDD4146790.1 DUF3830 family protein [Clostridia bacterium]MDD4666266.1 DUF3830 family protein [Clostridia bacterium]
MSKIVMEFEKGGCFEVVLNEAKAPQTCKAFLENLPFEASVLQARYAGEEFFYKMPLEVEPENLVMPQAGSIAFNSDPKWQAVCVYYGPSIKVGNPFSLFAEVKGDLKELQKVGVRIWKEGQEKVTLKKL